MARPTVDVFQGKIVFVCGKPTAGCADPDCRERATAECAHLLTGKREGDTCGRRFCARHGMAVGGVLRCGPHARVAMKARV